MAQVSEIPKIPVEAIQNLDEQQAVNIISNTVNNNDQSSRNSIYSYQPIFNPIDKIILLYDEKIAVYEWMLKEKDEMIGRLEKVLERKYINVRFAKTIQKYPKYF